MQHTKPAPAFARGGHLRAEDMDLGTETRDVWLAVTSNEQQRARLMQSPLKHVFYRVRRTSERSCPLELLDRLIITMAACGFPEATVQLLLVHLNGVIARCYTGAAHRSLDELDLEETKYEALENELVIHRRVTGDTVTPEQLLREAEVNELEGTLQLERGKALRRRARALGRVLPFRGNFPRPMGVPS